MKNYTVTTNYKNNFQKSPKRYEFPATSEDRAIEIFEECCNLSIKYGAASYIVDMVLTNEQNRVITMLDF